MDYCRVESAQLLSPADEVELARRIEVGLYATRLREDGGHSAASDAELARLSAEGAAAAERFLMANVRLVSMVSRTIARATGSGEQDLFQEGFAALVYALYRFDHRQGYRFSSYALHWIRAGVSEAVSRHSFEPGAPADRTRIRHAWWRLAQRLRREPTVVEVAEALGIDTARVQRASHFEGAGVLLFDDARMFESADPEAEQRLGAIIEHSVPVHQWLAELPRLEARVLWLRFGFTGRVVGYAEAGRMLQLEKTRVRRLEARALDRLRELCHTDDLPAAS